MSVQTSLELLVAEANARAGEQAADWLLQAIRAPASEDDVNRLRDFFHPYVFTQEIEDNFSWSDGLMLIGGIFHSTFESAAGAMIRRTSGDVKYDVDSWAELDSVLGPEPENPSFFPTCLVPIASYGLYTYCAEIFPDKRDSSRMLVVGVDDIEAEYRSLATLFDGLRLTLNEEWVQKHNANSVMAPEVIAAVDPVPISEDGQVDYSLVAPGVHPYSNPDDTWPEMWYESIGAKRP